MHSIAGIEPPFELQVHRIRAVVILRYLTLSVLAVVGILVSIAFGVLRWQHALRNYGPASLWRWVTPALFFLALSIIIVIASLVMLLRTRRIELQLSSAGLCIQNGKKIDILRWGDVTQLQTSFVRYGILGLEWGVKTDLLIITEDKKRYRFNRAYEEIDSLVESTKQFVYPILLDKYRQSFKLGEPLTFGPLILTSEGVLNGRKALRWKDIGKIQLKQGILQVQPHENVPSPKLAVPARKIPNIDVCLQFIHHLGTQT
jgi:hypothetical protein